jgi:excinuclease UvrABC ATPase subunit
MCPRCEGMGAVNDIDLTQLYDDDKSLNEGAITIPGYSMDGWYGRIFSGCGLLRSGQADQEVHEEGALRSAPQGADEDQGRRHQPHVRGADPEASRSRFLSKDVDAMQPHVRAFVERAVTFTTCPDCSGTRLSEAARSSKIAGINIADACAMQISDLAAWVRGLDEPSVAPLLTTLRHTLDSFVEIGLGYLSPRPARRARSRAARRSARR